MIPLGILAASQGRPFDPSVDPHWSKVVCSMPMTDDFDDLKGNPVTVEGGCTIEEADGAVGGGCLVAPAASYLAIDLDAQLGGEDWTIEVFGRSSATANPFAGFLSVEALPGQDFALLSMTRGSGGGGSNHLWWCSSNGASWNIRANGDLGGGGTTWGFFAVQRRGGVVEAFRNGVKTQESPLTGVVVQKGPFTYLGKKSNELAGAYEMRLQHLRITKGVARYSSNFTPPDAPFPTTGP